MKKFVIIILSVGSFMSLASCQKESPDSSIGGNVRMVLSATQASTKTVLDGTTTTWKEGDKVTVMYKKTGESSWTTKLSEAAYSTDSYATATFSVDLATPDTNADAYAFYPANDVAPTATLAKITIASTQYPTGTSFDGNSDILISKAFKPTSGTVATQFARVGAVLKIKINNVSLSGEKLLSLSVTGANPLAGDVPVSLSSHGRSGNISNASASNTVTAVYPATNQFTIGSSDCFVYLIVSPQTLENGSTLTVSGITENYTFTKDIVLSQDIHLNAGHIVPLNITIESTTTKSGWYRVEDASWLAAGDRVVIANNDGTYVMKYDQKNNNRDGASIVVTGNTITALNSLAQEFVIESGVVSGSLAFRCDHGAQYLKYIYAAGTGSNYYLRSENSVTLNSSFIPVLLNGYGSLIAQGTNNNYLRYNSSSKLFSCYNTNSQNDISIYKYYGEYPGAFFGFDTASNVSSFGIDIPSSGANTNLDSENDYTSGNVKMRVTHGGTKTRVHNSDGTSFYLGIYKNGGSITFDAGTGKTITKIDFVASTFNMNASSGTLSSKSWVGDSQSVTFTATDSNNISSVAVKYQ